TVELKVRMDCDGCERTVRNALTRMSGVQSVDIDRKLQKVTVIGYIKPNEAVRKVKGKGKHVEIWPYVPYNSVANSVVSAKTYDKKAPHIRKLYPKILGGKEYQNSWKNERTQIHASLLTL
ncbi:hypothetical protein KI387_014915, partial [Taxus chinensis]